MTNSILLYLLILSAPCIGQRNINGLVQAEKNFAAYSLANGTKDAFLHFLDSNGIVFDQGKALNGMEVWNAREKKSGILNWHPEFTEIAASEDFGYTTGPWTFQPSLKDTIIARGQYTTVWHFNKQREWKFLVDFGISHSIPVPKHSLKKISYQKRKRSDQNSLLAAEKSFIQLYQQNGFKAYDHFLSSQSILNRNAILPSINKKQQQTIHAKTPINLTYTIVGYGIADSGDLGYVYGNTEQNDNKDNYLRIWRNEKQGWKIAVEVLH